MNLFELATRKNIMFPSMIGSLNVIQLWQLPLLGGKENLDNIAKSINSELKKHEEESFVKPKSNVKRNELVLMLDIVKHIINTKLQEQEENAERAKNAEQYNRLKEILASKQAKSLENLSEEEILDRMSKLKP